MALFPIRVDLSVDEDAASRVDVVAIDPKGQVVVVVVAEDGDNDTRQMVLSRGVAAARRLARWTSEDLFRLLDEDRAESLGVFLDVEVDAINVNQRIVVISPGFYEEILATAEWLRDHWGLKITCLEVVVTTDPETKVPYLISAKIS